jgi:putative membrane protein
VVGLAIRVLLNVVAILAADVLSAGVRLDRDAATLVAVGVVFGLVNAFVRPVLRLLAWPLAILTLGLAFFLVNVATLALTALLVPGFEIDGFVAAAVAALVVWVVNLVLERVLGLGD